jgi:hypothetical protein
LCAKCNLGHDSPQRCPHCGGTLRTRKQQKPTPSGTWVTTELFLQLATFLSPLSLPRAALKKKDRLSFCPDDPDVCVLRVTPLTAELWDGTAALPVPKARLHGALDRLPMAVEPRTVLRFDPRFPIVVRSRHVLKF